MYSLIRCALNNEKSFEIEQRKEQTFASPLDTNPSCNPIISNFLNCSTVHVRELYCTFTSQPQS